MSKTCLALFATLAFLCGFLVQHLGPGHPSRATRTPGLDGQLACPARALGDGGTASDLTLGGISFPDVPEIKNPPENPGVERDGLADAVARAADAVCRLLAENGGAPADSGVTRGTVEKGETLGGLLEKSSEGNVAHYLGAASKVFSPRGIREGQPYMIAVENGRLRRFEYEIDSKKRLVVEGEETPEARIEPIHYDIELATARAEISDSLFQTVADIGENPHLALKLVDLFGSEINFIRDLKEGDKFSALIEKRFRDGEFKGYGRILAARFTTRGKTFEAYLFNDGAGAPQYYNRHGENLKKTLLQSPLAFTRITSRFTNSRKHPILGYSRPHLGVDYGAPTGTPVKAVGEGVVTKRGWGGGYGNQIILRHTAALESMYAHLSGFARGLKPGAHVRQGQVIGFVGSTGLSTGPHLDFRLRQNGKFINPTKAINPRGASVSTARMAEFRKIMAMELAWLEGKKSLASYEPALFSPSHEKAESAKKTASKKQRAARAKRAERKSAKSGRRS